VTIGDGTSVLGLLRAWFLDRPHVKLIAVFNDYGPNAPGARIHGVGACVRVEVHCTGRVPVRVTWIGFELTNGQVIELDKGRALPKVLSRPDVWERWATRESLIQRLGDAGSPVRLKRIRVTASPDHVFRQRLPKRWNRFPESDPPTSPTDQGRPSDGSVRYDYFG
jgi:hypothetical protein